MWLYKFFKKPIREEVIELKASQIADFIVDDIHGFTLKEQAIIVKRVNTMFLERFTTIYNTAFNNQQAILDAKNILK